jgi:hypothetical protein
MVYRTEKEVRHLLFVVSILHVQNCKQSCFVRGWETPLTHIQSENMINRKERNKRKIILYSETTMLACGIVSCTISANLTIYKIQKGLNDFSR